MENSPDYSPFCARIVYFQSNSQDVTHYLYYCILQRIFAFAEMKCNKPHWNFIGEAARQKNAFISSKKISDLLSEAL